MDFVALSRGFPIPRGPGDAANAEWGETREARAPMDAITPARGFGVMGVFSASASEWRSHLFVKQSIKQRRFFHVSFGRLDHIYCFALGAIKVILKIIRLAALGRFARFMLDHRR